METNTEKTQEMERGRRVSEDIRSAPNSAGCVNTNSLCERE